MTTARKDRPFDIVVWGATGFTGALVAEYLARHRPEGLRWALGGRNEKKLAAVRERLAVVDPSLSELPLLVGDSHDKEKLADIAGKTRVIVSTVGPFAEYGAELVAACVDAGTDYADITGEPHFVREMIDRHHEHARETGARIVHCSGYDSIPSDLGTLTLQEYAKEHFGAPFREVKCFAGESKGGVSGGTIASMMLIVEKATKDRDLRRMLGNPYALAPDPKKKGPDGPDPKGVRYDADLGRWTGPFVMAAINSRVVRRSNALLDYAYGEDFHYSEAMSFKAGPAGMLTAAAVSGGLALAMGGLALAPIRELAKKKLPGPGEGPSKEARESGFFKTRIIGTDARGAGGKRAVCTVAGTNDPGYGETAKMLGETALGLLDEPRGPGGVLTPASSLGMHLVERLRNAGMTFEVSEL